MKGNIRNINWKRIIYDLDEINKNLKSKEKKIRFKKAMNRNYKE